MNPAVFNCLNRFGFVCIHFFELCLSKFIFRLFDGVHYATQYMYDRLQYRSTSINNRKTIDDKIVWFWEKQITSGHPSNGGIRIYLFFFSVDPSDFAGSVNLEFTSLNVTTLYDLEGSIMKSSPMRGVGRFNGTFSTYNDIVEIFTLGVLCGHVCHSGVQP